MCVAAPAAAGCPHAGVRSLAAPEYLLEIEMVAAAAGPPAAPGAPLKKWGELAGPIVHAVEVMTHGGRRKAAILFPSQLRAGVLPTTI